MLILLCIWLLPAVLCWCVAYVFDKYNIEFEDELFFNAEDSEKRKKEVKKFIKLSLIPLANIVIGLIILGILIWSSFDILLDKIID